jgi:hypothetical protein
LGEIEMNWLDRANVISRFYAARGASQLVVWRRARAGREVEGLFEDSLRNLIDQGVNSIIAYHESGESDEAFTALRLEADALADAAARSEQGCVATSDSFLAKVRTKVELMYDANTAERLMVAFECGCGPAGRPRSRGT